VTMAHLPLFAVGKALESEGSFSTRQWSGRTIIDQTSWINYGNRQKMGQSLFVSPQLIQ